jgi:hypothetical protein
VFTADLKDVAEEPIPLSCSTELTGTPEDDQVVEAGGTVEYTITDTNDGSVALTEAHIDVYKQCASDGSPSLVDTLATGDAIESGANDDVMSPGESFTWTYETPALTEECDFWFFGHGLITLSDGTTLDVTADDPINDHSHGDAIIADPDEKIQRHVSVVDAAISITPDGVNEVGNSHDFTITATTSHPAGVTVDFINITPTGDTGLITADDCVDDDSSTATSCTVTVNSNNVTSATIGADLEVQFSDDSSSDTATVNRSTDGTTTAGGLDNSGDATKHWVDAAISIEPDGVNEVGNSHDFTITVTTDAPAGVTVTSVSITPTGDTGLITAEDCDEAGAGTALTCTVTVNSNNVTSATIGATTTVVFDDDNRHRVGHALDGRQHDGQRP